MPAIALYVNLRGLELGALKKCSALSDLNIDTGSSVYRQRGILFWAERDKNEKFGIRKQRKKKKERKNRELQLGANLNSVSQN